jgi:hypothetical protein
VPDIADGSGDVEVDVDDVVDDVVSDVPAELIVCRSDAVGRAAAVTIGHTRRRSDATVLVP